MSKLLQTLKSIDSPYVAILIGPPLSGKTTEINKIINELGHDVTIISRDKIVLDVYGENDYNKAFSSVNQKRVDTILLDQIRNASDNNHNVILDMTHMTRKRRKYNLSFFDNYYKIGVIFPILSMEEYDVRNKKRSSIENKTIPTKVLKDMISSYQTISDDEGFDKIISL